MPFISRINNLVLICLCLASSIANAQTKDMPKANANTPAPVAATPERTAASFGDWVLRCEAAAAPVKRICEVAQLIALQGQTNPIAQVAIGRVAATEPNRLTVMLTPDIAIQAKPQIAVAKNVSVELSWQNCTPGGCVATAAMTVDTIRTFSAQTESGRILFKDAAGRDVVLPLSFRGLSQALAALAKET